MPNSYKTLSWVIFEFVLIFILLSLPGNEFQDHTSWISKLMQLPYADKIMHMALFGSLAISIFFHFEISKYHALKSTRAKALALIVCIVYGIALEYYQKYYAPSRGFEVLDMLADAVGAICALPLFELLKNRFSKYFSK